MKHQPSDLVEAAIALIDREGVGISTAQVAAEAGVSNGTLFHYFPNKQALIDATYRTLKTELAAMVGPLDPGATTKQQCYALWSGWVGWAQQSPHHYRVMQLLHHAELVSPSAVADTEALFAGHVASLEAARADLVDLPLAYLVESVQAQIAVAVTNDLDQAAQDRAFEAAWRSVCAPESSTTTPWRIP